jgi:hypothetical protein
MSFKSRFHVADSVILIFLEQTQAIINKGLLWDPAHCLTKNTTFYKHDVSVTG